jgi:hypothetical protein
MAQSKCWCTLGLPSCSLVSSQSTACMGVLEPLSACWSDRNWAAEIRLQRCPTPSAIQPGSESSLQAGGHRRCGQGVLEGPLSHLTLTMNSRGPQHSLCPPYVYPNLGDKPHNLVRDSPRARAEGTEHHRPCAGLAWTSSSPLGLGQVGGCAEGGMGCQWEHLP